IGRGISGAAVGRFGSTGCERSRSATMAAATKPAATRIANPSFHRRAMCCLAVTPTHRHLGFLLFAKRPRRTAQNLPAESASVLFGGGQVPKRMDAVSRDRIGNN